MPTAELITSIQNPLVKRVRSLADRKHRRREGAFVVQGVQPVWRAGEAGWAIETLIVVPEWLPESAERMVAEQRARGGRVVEFGAELAARLTDRDRPPGLFAVVRTRTSTLAELPVDADAVFVALHDVGNPGNLGTVVRTADAAGASGVILIGPVAEVGDATTFLAWARRAGVEVLAASGYAEPTHWSVPYRAPLAVLLGSEGEGLPADVMSQADRRVRIPMVGTAESLNLAVAAGLMLYEARRAALGGP
jgi:RNA methyltransferase, TrmH family